MNGTHQESQDRVISPEALDAYVRVAKPGAGLMIAALFVFTAALLIWGFTGTLPKTLTVNGVLDDRGYVVCYVEAAELDGNIEGCPARIYAPDGEVTGASVTRVGAYPLSGAEIAASQSSDWMADMLSVDGYAYEVVLAADKTNLKAGDLLSVTLITSEIKPISLLFN
jgi:hypothetical protein